VEEFSSNDRVETLAAEVAELREQMSDLQRQFAAFRKQFE
jgi:chaperonin cofactor prefoldin